MSKIVLGLAVGGLLGLIDGLSVWITAPDVAATQGPTIAFFATLKGILTGGVIGVSARRVDSVPGGLAFGLAAGLVLAFLAALGASSDGETAYASIMIPGALIGLIVGYVTQRFGGRRAVTA